MQIYFLLFQQLLFLKGTIAAYLICSIKKDTPYLLN